jgi:CrcB protein
MIWIAVALGGAAGSIARHAVNERFGLSATPYATATVNIVGSLLIGVLAGLDASGRLRLPQEMRAFVFVGVLGGFTTFSSLMLDTLTLSRTAQPLAVSNIAAQIGLGAIAVFAGYAVAR